MKKIETPNSGAIIQFSRIVGQKVLYGSPFYHQGFIRLRIDKAQTYISDTEIIQYYSDNNNNYIEVDLSFSQFAELITSMNIGDGVPCTINRLKGEKFDDPWIEDNRLELDKDIEKETNSTIESIKEMIDLIENEKLTKTVKTKLIQQCHKIIKTLNDKLPFIAEMYAEHLDKLEQKSKTEIAAYCDLAVRHVGLNTLKFPQLPEILND